MTKEEMIELAREALKQEPREDWNSTAWVFADETLQAFAKLVAEKEREKVTKEREFIGLTYEEKHAIRYSHMNSAEFIEFIEAKLKDKNTSGQE